MYRVDRPSRTMIMITGCIVVMMPMCVAMHRTANDFQAMMVAGVRLKTVQTLPE
jgi:hypothetical protein